MSGESPITLPGCHNSFGLCNRASSASPVAGHACRPEFRIEGALCSKPGGMGAVGRRSGVGLGAVRCGSRNLLIFRGLRRRRKPSGMTPSPVTLRPPICATHSPTTRCENWRTQMAHHDPRPRPRIHSVRGGQPRISSVSPACIRGETEFSIPLSTFSLSASRSRPPILEISRQRRRLSGLPI